MSGVTPSREWYRVEVGRLFPSSASSGTSLRGTPVWYGTSRYQVVDGVWRIEGDKVGVEFGDARFLGSTNPYKRLKEP